MFLWIKRNSDKIWKLCLLLLNILFNKGYDDIYVCECYLYMYVCINDYMDMFVFGFLCIIIIVILF